MALKIVWDSSTYQSKYNRLPQGVGKWLMGTSIKCPPEVLSKGIDRGLSYEEAKRAMTKRLKELHYRGLVVVFVFDMWEVQSKEESK